jgi:GntR family transcriptional regulator
MVIHKDETAGAVAFRLDHSSGVPTYLQLVQQVEQALRLGLIGQGDQLPTVKDVAGTLAINPNTVMKAYRELEHRGLAGGRPGQGTFITGALRRIDLAEQAVLAGRLRAWVRDAVSSGLDDHGITAMFAAVLRDLRDQRKEGVA